MVYILDPSDTGVPLVRCLLVGAHLIHVTGRDTWVVTCPLGAPATCWPPQVSQLPGDEVSGVHISDLVTRCPPEYVQGGVTSLGRC